MAEKELNLLADFPAVTTEQWKNQIIKDLKGADYDRKLVWKTDEGFNVQPFYRAENLDKLKTDKLSPGEFPYVQGTKTDDNWLVRQNLQVDDAREANAKALDILNKGVNSLGFTLKSEKLSPEYVATLLKDIQADKAVELNFRVCVKHAAEFAKILIDYFRSKNYDLTILRGSINLDPINRMLLKGKQLHAEFISETLTETANILAELPQYQAVTVNALTLSNAGATVAQELGYALAWGNQYLNMLIDKGVQTANAAKTIRFTFGVSSNYFMEIAKFRAARWLWAQIVAAYKPQCTCGNDCNCMVDSGLDFCPCCCAMHIHAETSYFNLTVFDANVNMLRTQTEAMSAALGSVNSLTVLPYDCAYKQSDDFSERIARNQQLLLKEESHFDKVADPAAGSYYIESLTNELAHQAWELFLATEEHGGFFKTVESGRVQAAVNESATARRKSVSSRKEILLGTNQYPNFTENTNGKIEHYNDTAEHSCTCDDGIPTLKPTRQAVDFEQLRLSTEKAKHTPKVFMLTIGNLAMRLARAQFSSNFFGCAGYEIIDNIGFDTVADGIKAATQQNADIIVLCSSDEEYADIAPEAFKLLTEKQILVIAGAPACTEDLKKIGINRFINVKSNVLETLKGFNAMLGI
ncbi:MAG: methylmalonyl-CoA mutase small subunit [Prevotellaceae bacterium]|jgi:methylmalonyl-CoA mutase|nr:methylmalonyl-CoA mutase small subunit [Prevotellaceae bacterium]